MVQIYQGSNSPRHQAALRTYLHQPLQDTAAQDSRDLQLQPPLLTLVVISIVLGDRANINIFPKVKEYLG